MRKVDRGVTESLDLSFRHAGEANLGLSVLGNLEQSVAGHYGSHRQTRCGELNKIPIWRVALQRAPTTVGPGMPHYPAGCSAGETRKVREEGPNP